LCSYSFVLLLLCVPSDMSHDAWDKLDDDDDEMMNNDDINSMIIIGWLVVIAAEAEWVVQKLEYRYSLFAIRFYSF